MVRLLAVLGTLAAAAPAAADTTFTQAVTPGATFRTAEGPPTEATPLIVGGTISGCDPSFCPSGPVTLTVTIHGDAAGGLDAENFEGDTNEIAAAGGVVDVSLSGADAGGRRALGVATISFDVDRSLLYPGFRGLGGTKTQLATLLGDPGKTPKPDRGIGGTNEKLGDGDLRVTNTAEGGGAKGFDPAIGERFWLDQSFLPVQPWAVAKLLSVFAVKAELSDALKNGVRVAPRSYYDCDLNVKMTVSSAVAKQLKLASTTIGTKKLGPACEGRVPIAAAAKRKLRKHSKVTGKVTVTSRNADGTKTVSSARLELT